jgi:hypothetical protein
LKRLRPKSQETSLRSRYPVPRDALLEDYASLVPDALDELDATERHHVYRMLRVEAQVAPDGSLEVSGDVISVCEMEPLSL